MNQNVLISELQFRAVRSGGPGGQHANKVSSKVQLLFDVLNSKGLSELEKSQINKKLSNLISKEGLLQLSAEAYRSQHRNKEAVTKRFLELIKKASQKPKKRKPTKRTKASIEKRLDSKKRDAQKKAFRKRPDY